MIVNHKNSFISDKIRRALRLYHTRGIAAIYCTEVMKISYLSDLVPGEAAFINKIGSSEIRQRLFDLGFIGGTKVECVARAPLGGPGAYLVRGSVIALRNSDARCVCVQRIPSRCCSQYKKWV